ncbi:MAG: flagellar basal body L-ring protein FlgH [Gemmatimonadetes bacterium]|nr:flagellar basal body L-ring protein FlgH [Gemmatimonadota bacterium]
MTFSRSFRTATRLATLVATLVAMTVASRALEAQARGAAQPVKPVKPVVLDSTTLDAPVRSSWTSDRVRFGVGDIITVLIDERTLAAATLTDNASDTRQKSMGLNVRPPASPTGLTPNVNVGVDVNNNGNSNKSGSAARQNTFRSEMSVRVVAVSPTGMVKISGHKTVNVDKNQQDVVLSGWVRPQDISVGTNTVESARIADAELNYVQKGALGAPKSGIITRVLGALWP